VLSPQRRRDGKHKSRKEFPGHACILAFPLAKQQAGGEFSHMAPSAPRQVIPLFGARDSRAATLQDLLDQRAKPGELWYAEGDDGSVRCTACGHRCLIREGRRGICKVRFNRNCTLYVPSGYAAGVQVDPTEKKPFFHVLPGSDCLTFGMLGCDFHCGYCQNWLTSQALRDPSAGAPTSDISAETLVRLGRQHGARVVASSYNEPLITAEWAMEIFRLARPAGFKTAFVSNGNATAEVLDYIRPWTDCYKIDFKAMQDRAYRALGGVLQHVLDAMRMVYERGFWMEIVTLVVPGFNDAPDDLRRMADAITAVSTDIPWHVTAFHQDYKMTDPRNTAAEDLLGVCEIGRNAGLKFIYAGNLPGRVGRWENTWCPDCGELLIERLGYQILRQRVTQSGGCPACGARIAGIWS
jgi:pyruvate formate lyase activating enzyme